MNKKEKKHKALIGTIIFYVISAFLVYYIALNVIVPDKVVDYAGFQLSVIPSGSMEPNINIGDIVIFTSVNQDEIEEGDIVAFYNNTNMNGTYEYVRIVHRVIEIKTVNGEEQIITQGDNNDDPDVIRAEDDASEIITLTRDMIVAQVPQIGSNNWALRIPLLGYIVLVFQWLVRLLAANPILLLLVIVNIGIIITLIVVLKKGKTDLPKDNKNHIEAEAVNDDDLHDRHDDEEDGEV